MSAAARSLVAWGIYLVAFGVSMLIVPDLLLRWFHLPETETPYIRIIGILFLVLSYYMFRAALAEWTPFFRWSVHARAPIIIVVIVLVLLRLVAPLILVFGTVDLIGALATALALRHDARRTA